MSILDQPFDPAQEAARVTGAVNGIGRTIAQALVAEGVRTVFADVGSMVGEALTVRHCRARSPSIAMTTVRCC